MTPVGKKEVAIVLDKVGMFLNSPLRGRDTGCPTVYDDGKLCSAATPCTFSSIFFISN